MDASVDGLVRKRTLDAFVMPRSSAAVATQSTANTNATAQAIERITFRGMASVARPVLRQWAARFKRPDVRRLSGESVGD